MMSDLRKEFYAAVNKANNQKPKKAPVVTKKIEEKKVSIEQQISDIVKESDLAATKFEVIINNQPLIDWLYEVTKHNKESFKIQEKVNKELEIINKLREDARREWRNLNRTYEKVNTPTAAASAAAGSAGGRISITIDPSTNEYVVDDYIDNYLF